MPSSGGVSEPIQYIRVLSHVSYDIEYNCLKKNSVIF